MICYVHCQESIINFDLTYNRTWFENSSQLTIHDEHNKYASCNC
uniref:Uncharacterized protein n=1 Tax=Rhizophora mucronata TaxID=61149 RepID=A0A2P2R1M8_RHIMU